MQSSLPFTQRIPSKPPQMNPINHPQAKDTTRSSAKLDLGIALALSEWSDLTLAISSQWGGPDSADKRDYPAGAISDILSSESEIDEADLIAILLLYMFDEFGVHVQDKSEKAVAKTIMQLKEECKTGDFSTVDAMFRKWVERKGKGVEEKMRAAGNEEDSEDDEDVSEDEDKDEEMS